MKGGPTAITELVTTLVVVVVLAGCTATPLAISHIPTSPTAASTTGPAEACDVSRATTIVHVGGPRDLGNSLAVKAHITVGSLIAITATRGQPIVIARVTGPDVLDLVCNSSRPDGIAAVFRATSAGDASVDMNSNGPCTACAIYSYEVAVAVTR
jgi:hypothetical protein